MNLQQKGKAERIGVAGGRLKIVEKGSGGKKEEIFSEFW